LTHDSVSRYVCDGCRPFSVTRVKLGSSKSSRFSELYSADSGGFITTHTANSRSTQPCIPAGVAESSTSFGWGKGGNVTSAGWQVTLCDPIWHVSSRSGVETLRTAIHLLLTYLLTAILCEPELADYLLDSLLHSPYSSF